MKLVKWVLLLNMPFGATIRSAIGISLLKAALERDGLRLIADLRRIEKVLASTAAQCSGDEVPECPVLDALAS